MVQVLHRREKEGINKAYLAGFHTPKPSVDQIVDGTHNLLLNLDLTDKKFIVRKIVDKIVATQKEATIWGHIPIFATEQVGLDVSNRDCGVAERWKVDVV
jgi:hypothetical protein